MSSLPAAWVAVGCLLLLFAVVMTILFLLKAREVSTLKKQCEELRDTMRMMRYEEANLARMLHTASKSVGPIETVTEENADGLEALGGLGYQENLAVQQQEQELEQPQEVQEPKEPQEQPKELQEEPQEQMQEQEEPQEPQEQQEALASESLDSQEVLEEVESLASLEEQVEQPVVNDVAEEPQAIVSQKQPISERRSALPTDLFSAWFAENEEEQEVVATITQKKERVEVGKPVIAATAQEKPIVVEESTATIEEPIVMEELATEVVHPSEEATMSEEAVTLPMTNDGHETVEGGQESELNKEDERFCRKLERIVTNRMRNPNLNIDIIAAQFGIGRTNFYRKVREVMGMSPNDYLRKCRMERAAELLRSTDAPVSEVCAQVGMPDAQYFSRVFKTFYGTSPSIYRENNNQ